MPLHAIGQPAAAVGHHPHQLDAAAGPVVLVAKLAERRATRRTQSAMNAMQEQIVIDARGRVDGVRCGRVVEVVGVHGSYFNGTQCTIGQNVSKHKSRVENVRGDRNVL